MCAPHRFSCSEWCRFAGVPQRAQAAHRLPQQGAGRGLLAVEADRVRLPLPGDVHRARPQRRRQLRDARRRERGRQQRHRVHRRLHRARAQEPAPHPRPLRRGLVHGERALQVTSPS